MTEDMKKSIENTYASLIKRKIEQKAEEAQRKEEETIEKSVKKGEIKEQKQLSKSERRKQKREEWDKKFQSLLGDDLDNLPKAGKFKRRKNIKWYSADEETYDIKKKKKIDYNKKFEPEINLLKSQLLESKKFQEDLLKRFNYAVGPASKDSPMINKTMVEFASVLNASRSNTLNLIREISNVKKSAADLNMKHNKSISEMENSSPDITGNKSLTGSSIASMLFDNSRSMTSEPSIIPIADTPSVVPETKSANPVISSDIIDDSFDPSNWGNDSSLGSGIKLEIVPHEIVVRHNPVENKSEFKVLRLDDGEEIPDADVPLTRIIKIDENTMTARDSLNQTYKLQIRR